MRHTETAIHELLALEGVAVPVQPSNNGHRPTGRPKTTQVVVLNALEQIGKPATIGTVRKYCIGHRLGRPTINATLHNLTKSGEARRVARGIYELA